MKKGGKINGCLSKNHYWTFFNVWPNRVLLLRIQFSCLTKSALSTRQLGMIFLVESKKAQKYFFLLEKKFDASDHIYLFSLVENFIRRLTEINCSTWDHKLFSIIQSTFFDKHFHCLIKQSRSIFNK